MNRYHLITPDGEPLATSNNFKTIVIRYLLERYNEREVSVWDSLTDTIHD